MPLFGAYIDKKIIKGVGGEHSRLIQGRAPDEDAFRKSLKLRKDEALNQIVSLYDPGESPVAKEDAVVVAIANELVVSLSIDPAEALALAKGAIANAGGLT